MERGEQIMALHEALYSANALVLLLSPSLRQSQELFRKLLQAYGAVANKPPSLQESSLRLELPNGSRIVSLPGKEETVRGFSGVTPLVPDEALRVSDELPPGFIVAALVPRKHCAPGTQPASKEAPARTGGRRRQVEGCHWGLDLLSNPFLSANLRGNA